MFKASQMKNRELLGKIKDLDSQIYPVQKKYERQMEDWELRTDELRQEQNETREKINQAQEQKRIHSHKWVCKIDRLNKELTNFRTWQWEAQFMGKILAKEYKQMTHNSKDYKFEQFRSLANFAKTSCANSPTKKKARWGKTGVKTHRWERWRTHSKQTKPVRLSNQNSISWPCNLSLPQTQTNAYE